MQIKAQKLLRISTINMLRQSSNRSSISSRLSREDDENKSLRNRPSSSSQRSSSRSSGRISRHSKDSRSMVYDEEKASFYENCKTVYLMVFDDTKDEITSPEELMLLLQYAGQNPTNKMVKGIWKQFRDSITFYQFCDILKEEKPLSRGALIKAFKKIDVNGDGFVSHKELQNVLTMHGEPMTKSEIKSLMDDADYNGDGKLDYNEFCDMMLMTADKCTGMNKDSKTKDKEKTISERSDRRRLSTKDRKVSLKQEEKRTAALEEKRPLSAKIKSKRLKDSFSNDSDNSMLESSTAKIIKEPNDLSKWRYKNTKGYFGLAEDGSIASHHYKLLILESTEVFITIQALTPKYGKFCNELADSDVSIFLVQEGKQEKLVAYTAAKIDQKYCLRASIEAGSYQLLTFTSGVLLKQGRDGPENPSKLLIGEDDNAKFTKACRETLNEVFYRCDLDGNGFLSRKEFGLFQLETSGEECDDDAWEIVKENFEMNNKDEITPEGFLQLNLMEAKEDVEELWVTLKTMGYNKGLELTKAFPFQIEVFTRKGDSALEAEKMDSGGKKLETCLMNSIKTTSAQRPFKDNKNIVLYKSENGARTTLAVENKTYAPVKVRLLCNRSRNAVSNQDNLDFVCNLEAKDFQIVDHLIPKKKNQDVKVICEEFLLT